MNQRSIFSGAMALALSIFLSLPATELSAAPRTARFGQAKTDGAVILFETAGNNINGESMSLVLPGECTYTDPPETAPNTFSFSGENFPDLLIPRNGILNAEFEAESDTGHVGTLAISCEFQRRQQRPRRVRHGECIIQFTSPATGEQLDDCIAGIVFDDIRRGRIQ